MILTAYAQTAETMQPAVDTSIWHALLSASLVVQLTLLSLIVLSVLCWGVIFSKWRQFQTAKQANELFEKRFWKTASFESLYESIDEFDGSPLATMFKSAFVELQKLAEVYRGKIPLDQLDNLERVLRNSMDEEISKLESKLTILATTGATGPFIGLFGTVWGIMNSFQKIGAMGSAHLAVVAPGISEALVATAIGLLAAIPAVIAFNHWNGRIRRMELAMNGFSSDFLNMTKRNFFTQ